MRFDKLGKKYNYVQAIEYSEGNEKLKELLFHCVDNDIRTFACCAGHFFETKEEFYEHLFSQEFFTAPEDLEQLEDIEPANSDSYIMFLFDKNDPNLIKCLLESKMLNIKDILITCTKIESEEGMLHTLTFRINNDEAKNKQIFKQKADELFGSITQTLKNYDTNKNYSSSKYNINHKLNNMLGFYSIEFCDNELLRMEVIKDSPIKIDNMNKITQGNLSIFINKDISIPQFEEQLYKNKEREK